MYTTTTTTTTRDRGDRYGLMEWAQQGEMSRDEMSDVHTLLKIHLQNKTAHQGDDVTKTGLVRRLALTVNVMTSVEPRHAVLGVRRQALDDRGAVGRQPDERAGAAAARADAAVRPRASGRRVTVLVTRPTRRRVAVGVARCRTARHARAVLSLIHI